MPTTPTITHAEYDARQPEWKDIHAVLDGRRALLDAGAEYVPMLSGQDMQGHRNYLMRGQWGGFTARAHDGIVGLVFSQEPQVEVPSTIEPLLDDITRGDMSFVEFAKAVFTETAAYAWGGILVDIVPEDEQETAEDDRPYLTHYDAASVRYWKRERINGMWKTTLVVLKERREIPDPENEYHTIGEDQFRVLYLRKTTNTLGEVTRVYEQHIWRLVTDEKGKEDWMLVETIIPLRRTETLDEIPWTFTPSKGVVPQIYKSPLLDMVDVNLDYWRLSVDIRHGGHFTALPTPCAAAVPDATELHIGSESVWHSQDANFKTWYLEFSGTGLGFVRDEMDSDVKLMATLGARLLETQKREAETAEAMTLRQAGENSVVMTLALSVGKALEKALWWMAWWQGMEEKQIKTSVSLTSALTELQLTTEDLRLTFEAYLAGELSQQTFLEAVARKQILRGRDWQDEQALIAMQGPRPGQEVSMELEEQRVERDGESREAA